MYKQIQIKPRKAKNIIQGHPWVFSGAIEKARGLICGDLCEIYCAERFIGIGYYNAATDIAIRILTRKREAIDHDFFVTRFQDLANERAAFIKDTNAYRLVFGESDGLPGLIVDRYDQILVVQFHTLGIETMKDVILSALIEVYQPQGIYKKASVWSNKIEQQAISPHAEILYGEVEPEVLIKEHGRKFLVNIEKGQKTGFFLDQRENRQSIVPYCQDKKVLNCFCYTGGFSVYAAKVARTVTSVDISAPAIVGARQNFELNKLNPKKHQFVTADVFDYLKKIKIGEYDVIILDPPSFAHSRRQLPQAIRGYLTINSKALEKLALGGILISSSCTAHVDEGTFLRILFQSAVNTRCQLKVLASALQPADHPYNLHFPEGRYLKFFILQKCQL